MSYDYKFVKIMGGVTAPKGFHYMPNGRLMSDADHVATHGYLERKITNLIGNLKDVDYTGETRSFTITGDDDAVFSLDIYDDSGNYYNFDTRLFSSTRPNLKRIELLGVYSFEVLFPVIASSLRKYTIDVLTETAGNIKTRHVAAREVRYADGTIDYNNSTGSNSNILRKTIHQDVAKSLHLSCIAPSLYTTSAGTIDGATSTDKPTIDQDATDPKICRVGDKITTTGIAASIHALVTKVNPDNDNVNELTMSVADTTTDGAAITFTPPFNGMTPHSTDSTTGRSTITTSSGGSIKTNFSITCTAVTGRTFTVNRVPTVEDLCAFTTVTFGSAASAITGEDTSSSTYYRWPITNIANLSTGMSLDPARTGTGVNTTVPARISNYLTTKTLKSVTENRYSTDIVDTIVDDISVDGVDAVNNDITGIDRNGRITAQAGNITFDTQQADALKSDANVRIFAHGATQIKNLTGMDISLSDVVLTPTQISTTTTARTAKGSATVSLTEVGNISTASIVRGVGVDPTVVDPFVKLKSAASGAGNITIAAGSEIETGQTLYFDGASNIITITGTISISNMAIADTTLYFDVERFLTAS